MRNRHISHYHSLSFKLLLTALSSLTTIAAAAADDFFGQLCGMVDAVRINPGVKQRWTDIVERLSSPGEPLVVLLDNIEPSDPAAEYHRADPSTDPFHINGAVERSFDTRRGIVTSKGEFYNSLMPGVNYSMIEKTIAPGETINYKLVGHKGTQRFVIIPYESSRKVFDFRIAVNGSEHPSESDRTNICRIEIPSVASTDVITISASNSDTHPQAFVIINNNTKK